ncbi:catalase [Mycolicibacterium chubuense NBB4]|uniref:Catalase n=1 Tax=Mycolicibacterium chubuense (strain NBB4) TaxID=710421 RepID=I4BLS6_MYCCN|nr:catalase family protein [Mycolicibacterium chubuense]AFM18233.1 catalase [Mycolicibacterium chubuense NBB4]
MTDGGTRQQNAYLPYRPELAASPPGEDALISAMVRSLRWNNRLQYAKSFVVPRLKRNGRAHAIRDAHAKSCAVLYGELTVRTDLPPELRQGMFARPGKTYPLIARLSATSGSIRSDQVRGVRGLGLKVLGVYGESGERADARFSDSNQDFVFVTEPMFLFSDAADYAKSGMRTARVLAWSPDAAVKTLNVASRLARRAMERRGRELPPKLKVFADPNHHVLGQTFYTAAPIRFGDYVAKLKVAPSSPSVTRLIPRTISRSGYDALTEAVVGFFDSNSAEYELSAQLCTNEIDMPIEDATVRWPEDSSPYRPVATIRYPVQTAYSNELRDFGDDSLTFNSWRGIAEHRPLGSINRLKLRVYEASSEYRHAKNKVDRTEPTDLSAFGR